MKVETWALQNTHLLHLWPRRCSKIRKRFHEKNNNNDFLFSILFFREITIIIQKLQKYGFSDIFGFHEKTSFFIALFFNFWSTVYPLRHKKRCYATVISQAKLFLSLLEFHFFSLSFVRDIVIWNHRFFSLWRNILLIQNLVRLQINQKWGRR